jgi:hypothetical protein
LACTSSRRDRRCAQRSSTWIGEGAYKGLFSLVSAAGLVLLVFGYNQMQGLGRGNPQLWVPAV